VQEKWGKLTGNDLTTLSGKREQLAGVAQQNYGSAKELADQEPAEFPHGLIPIPISNLSEGRSRDLH
jgi:hypothetical protein